ncbi:hypothetical protein QYF36_017042 [Acer negundo]|nr:hypothetical protein QYF36_017042 [Acer negundo]
MMEDVLAKAYAQIKWEEDESNFIGKVNNYSNRTNDRVDRKNDRISEPYPTGTTRNVPPRQENSNGDRLFGQNYPRTNKPRLEVLKYNLSSEPVDLVSLMKEMGKTIKWPRKMNAPPEYRDARLRCEFHEDHGHRTEDCVALMLEVAELLKRGHLQESLTDKGKQTAARHDEKRPTINYGPPDPSRQDRVINYIVGGSEVSGFRYSAAKKHTRQVDETQLGRRTTMLTGFGGEQKSTLGEIVLPIYAGGVNLYINFLILDCQSPYNAILSRPWIHEMKAIPVNIS